MRLAACQVGVDRLCGLISQVGVGKVVRTLRVWMCELKQDPS